MTFACGVHAKVESCANIPEGIPALTSTKLAPLALLFVATCLSPAAAAGPADAPNPTFTGRDLFDLSAAADPQISPDGRTVAYVRRSTDIMSDKARLLFWFFFVALGVLCLLVVGF